MWLIARGETPTDARLMVMEESLPLVRLSKNELWAVCARMECGERFARRIDIPPGLWSKAVDAAGNRIRNPRKATLDFVPGWVRSGDTWHMSERARKRLSEGKPPAYRREPYSYEHEDARRDRRWNAFGFTKNDHGLPILVECPACGLLQLADPVALKCR